jgi:hypothetical protein
MIGVLCAPRERETVAEIFELFKTPWCFSDEGVPIDALLVSAEAPSAPLDAPVIVAFGGHRTWVDDALDLSTRETRSGGQVVGDGLSFPLLGQVLTLGAEGTVIATLSDSGGPVAVELDREHTLVLRCGYDLVGEAATLLSAWQRRGFRTIVGVEPPSASTTV